MCHHLKTYAHATWRTCVYVCASVHVCLRVCICVHVCARVYACVINGLNIVFRV